MPHAELAGQLPDHDHDALHDHDELIGSVEDNPIWQQDNVILSSVGIDIGSSGTQVLFSQLHLRRLGEDLTSRYTVIGRETTYRSPVTLTPYAGAHALDAEAIGAIIDDAYEQARMGPHAIDTGVVILTGEALARHNAERIAAVLADRGGDLVTASAGHNMEAMLAAYGSGAAQASYQSDKRLLNIDIGGGTTKLALIESGRVTATAALHIGGRLVVLDESGRVERLEDAGREHAARAGLVWQLGDDVRPEQRSQVAESMAANLIAALRGDPAVANLWLTEPLGELGELDGVRCSGGVAEYVYDRESHDFGDLGGPLGRAVRVRLDAGALPAPLLPAGECIRATALGASEYSIQLSGSTSYISAPDRLLPRRNLQVVRPVYDLGEQVDSAAITAAVRRHLLTADAGSDVALALSWQGIPSYQRLRPFAQGVCDGLGPRTKSGRAVYLMLDADVAMTLGRLLRHELAVTADVLVIDGLWLREFDYLDIGRVRRPSGTVPVTIKSLVFSSGPLPPDPGRPRTAPSTHRLT